MAAKIKQATMGRCRTRPAQCYPLHGVETWCRVEMSCIARGKSVELHVFSLFAAPKTSDWCANLPALTPSATANATDGIVSAASPHANTPATVVSFVVASVL